MIPHENASAEGGNALIIHYTAVTAPLLLTELTARVLDQRPADLDDGFEISKRRLIDLTQNSLQGSSFSTRRHYYSHSIFSSNLPTLKGERPRSASFASGSEDLSQAMKLNVPPVVPCTLRRSQIPNVFANGMIVANVDEP